MRLVIVVAAGTILGVVLSLAVAAYAMSPDDRRRIAEDPLGTVCDTCAQGVSFLIEQYYGLHGRLQARRDIANGQLQLRLFGYRSPESDLAWQAELDAYDVKLVRYAGCIVDSRDLGLIKGYNSVMWATIDRRFGEGTLELTLERAHAARRQP